MLNEATEKVRLWDAIYQQILKSTPSEEYKRR